MQHSTGLERLDAEHSAALRVYPLQSEMPLGVSVSEVSPSVVLDVFRELTNKIAWAVGTTYQRPYNNRRCPAREMAWTVAKHIVEQHGYPANLAK